MINYFSVQNDLEENSWQLVSTEYKNLKTPLKMICPKGHEVEDNYEHWRKYHICEKCLGGKGNKIRKEVPLKEEGTYRILALDAATVTSGFSIYDDGDLVSYGTFTIDRDLDTTERINKFKVWLINAINSWTPDYVEIEHIQLQLYGKANSPQVEVYRVLANLQGIILDTLFELDVPCELVYASTWRKVCGIGETGRENKKKLAQEKVATWYGIKATQDEADAICIGKYAIKNHKKSTWGEDIE